MLSALPLVDDTWFIDNTTLETGTTCPRQFEYYHLRKRERNSERSALKFGDIMHQALEVKYRNLQLSPAEQTELMFAKVVELFGNYTPPEEDFRNLDTAINAVRHYQELYPHEPFVVAASPTDGTALVEVPFTVPLTEFAINSTIPVRNPDGTIINRHVGTVRVVWQGRIDLVYLREGRYYPMDHKTTSMMGPSYFREFDISSQFRGYGWSLREMGIKPEAFVINALGIRKPTKSGKAFEFMRHTVTMLDESLDEWKNDTIHILADLLGMMERGFFPKHTKWCVGKYGECQFYNTCILPQSQRDMMLSTGDYREVTWNPLAERSV